MESIEKHIEKDKQILQDPTVSPQQRRHVEEELHELEVYVENHKEEIAAGDHHDPSPRRLAICRSICVPKTISGCNSWTLASTSR